MKPVETLVSELKELVKREREVTLEILHRLREVETRKIYLEQGYPSLFEWAVSVLGYSAGSAQRRIQSMRLLKALPEMEERIAEGSLSLSVATQAQVFFRREDQRLKSENQESLSVQSKREIVESLVGASSREAERKLAALSPDLSPPEKIKAISDQKTLIQFTADSKLLQKLERLKELMSHQNFEGKLSVLIEQMADIALKELEPEAPKSPTPAPESETKSRYIPIELKRQVWKRDQGQCTFRDSKTGRSCSSRHALEFDHLRPYALGGKHSLENLTLRCSAHNAYSAHKMGLTRFLSDQKGKIKPVAG